MPGIDLIVAAPWIIFAVVLATICILLLRSRRGSRRDRQKPAHGQARKEENGPPRKKE